MDNVDIERRLTGGKASYVIEVRHDPEQQTLVIELTCNPDNVQLSTSLRCVDVSLVEHRWYVRDSECMEGFLGLHLERVGTRYRYLFVTEQREISFCTSTPATVVAA